MNHAAYQVFKPLDNVKLQLRFGRCYGGTNKDKQNLPFESQCGVRQFRNELWLPNGL